MNIAVHDAELFFLIFLRLNGLFLFVPIFNSKNTPFSAKIGISFFLAAIVFLWVPLPSRASFDTLGYCFAIVREVSVGAVIGLMVNLVFCGVRLAGNMISVQMGLGVANIYDPEYGGTADLMAQAKGLLVLMIFLSVNGPHWLIEAIVRSYDLIPLGGMQFSSNLAGKLMSLFGSLFVIAVRIGGPIIVSLWLVSLILGILGRLVPQMNVFMLEFPSKILVGLLAMIVCLPYFHTVFGRILGQFWQELAGVIRMMAG